MTYQWFRIFSDSWGLVAMALLWASFIGWAFLPANRDRNRAAAHMIFDEDFDDG
jgi:cytochrome c oxidase cbb3-type subunit 4